MPHLPLGHCLSCPESDDLPAGDVGGSEALCLALLSGENVVDDPTVNREVIARHPYEGPGFPAAPFWRRERLWDTVRSGVKKNIFE